MRTVHETEALRPSDPVPKSHPSHPLNHPRRLYGDTHASSALASSSSNRDRFYVPEDGYDSDEEKLPPKELLRLLKRKQRWAEREHQELKEALEKLDKRRREAWIKKEMLLDRVLVTELGEEEARKLSLDCV